MAKAKQSGIGSFFTKLTTTHPAPKKRSTKTTGKAVAKAAPKSKAVPKIAKKKTTKKDKTATKATQKGKAAAKATQKGKAVTKVTKKNKTATKAASKSKAVAKISAKTKEKTPKKTTKKTTSRSGAKALAKKPLTPAERLRAKRAALRVREEARRAAARAKRERLQVAARNKRERLQTAAKAAREKAKLRALAAREKAKLRKLAARERAAKQVAAQAAKAERVAARVALTEIKRQERAARTAAKVLEREAKIAAKALERQAALDEREAARRLRLGLPALNASGAVNEDGSPAIDFATAINSLVASANAGHIPLSDVESMLAEIEKSQAEEIPDIAAVLTALAERGVEVDDEIEEGELREATEKAVRIISSYAGEGDLDAFQQWRRDALSHPILTRAEETELTTRYLLYTKTAKALEAARERLEEQIAPLREALGDPENDETYRAALRPEIKRIEEEQQAMDREIERAKSLAENAENEFISFNFRLVVAIANRKFRQAGRKGEFMDLIQEGNRGMVEAFRRFDPTKGWKFSTFASWHIQQVISLWLYEQVGVLRVPTHRWRDARDIDKIRMEFQQRGEKATLEQIAERMGKTPKKIQEILAAQTLTRTGSLDKPATDEDGSATIGELVGDEKAANPADVAVSEALKTIFADAFERVLDGRERRVLQLRYGMYDQEKKTLDWIGRRMNITRERVRQIEERALAKLRKDREIRAVGDGRVARDMLGEA